MNLTSAKIVKVGRNGKKQACMLFPLPRRLLSYGKIVKVGRNGKKQACMFFPLPRRLLSYGKIVKVERNGKKQACMFFPIAEAHRTEAESKSDGRAKGILCFEN